MIVLENIVKSYPNGVGAINGISLHIERGEFVFIVGDSGSGKSTLIKLQIGRASCRERVWYLV